MSSLVPSGRAGALASLARVAGPLQGEELAVPAPVVTLGRASACDVVIDDDSVSARHARLEFAGGGWSITDLGSVNGTAVGGARLAPEQPTPLPYGATVRLGGVQLQFREVEAANVEAARAEYVAPEAPRTLREQKRGGFPVWLAVVVLVILAVIAMIVYTMTQATPVSTGLVTVPLPVLAMAYP
ncbi:MAG TPA: FHA domain-containing protein [Longimicrobium sp.]|jgi:hypothetical protein|uniref:FHA domain-containing protein n=1 Tax=Longimicrobium sp. TaxID=2029185 RepID=UPI002ED96490